MSARRVVEIPYALFKTNQIPSTQFLTERGTRVGSNGLHPAFLSADVCPEFGSVVSWLDGSMRGRTTIFGRFSIEVFDYRVERLLLGYSIYFQVINDAIHFKLMWSDYYEHQMLAA